MLDDINRLLKIPDPEIWLVTAADRQRRGGLIATFVNSASIVPSQPRVVVGIARQHFTWELIEASGGFLLHLLAETQLDLAWTFGLHSSRTLDKFANVPFTMRPNGCPKIDGTLGWLECRVEKSFDTGDRSLYLAEVVEGEISGTKGPLTMSRLLQGADPERLRALHEGLLRDAAVDERAITQWRSSFMP